MAKLIDILNEINTKDIAEYMTKKRSTADVNYYISVVSMIKSLDVEDSNVKIIDMFVVDDDSTCENPSYSNSVVGFENIDNEDILYDISLEKWNRVLGMEIADTCLQHMLPVEVVGDILLEITNNRCVSPIEPQLVKITEENFAVSKELAYKACNVADDRTEHEKDYDKSHASYTYHRIRDLFLSMVRVRA